MRLTALFSIVFCLQISAKSYTQEVTLSGKNLPLKQILKEIEKQTDYYVVYNRNVIMHAQSMTIDVHRMPLREFLTFVLDKQNLDYIIENRTIILKQKDRPNIDIPHLDMSINAPPPLTGLVKNTDGNPLRGASITIKGTNKGTVTDDEGRFTLEVTKEQVLVISFVGYEKTEIMVKDFSPITVILSPSNYGLDQVVVVGYGTSKKKDLTGAVSSIQGDVLTERNETQVSRALQGAVPGVMVTRDNGAPGSAATIRIRGMTTIGDNSPLVLVDGVPTSNIDNVNPNDIESISVLKDAASASIYGARAAAGVILITTKRAKQDQLSIQLSYNRGIERPTEMPKFADAVRYMQMVNELRWNDIGNTTGSEYPVFTKDVIDDYANLHATNPDVYPATDWKDILLKNQVDRESYFLIITGGSKTVQSKFSLGYDNMDGLYMGKGYKRLTARVNNNITLHKNLKAYIDLRARRAIFNDPSESPMTNIYRAAPIYAAIWSNGLVAAGKDGNNMYAQLLLGGENKTWQNQLGGRAALEFTPLKGLKLTGVIAPEFNYNKDKDFRKKVQYTNYNDPTVYVGTTDWGGTTSLAEGRGESYSVTAQLLIDYNKKIQAHDFGVMAGFENYYYYNESMQASSSDLTLDSYPFLDLGNPNFVTNSGSAYENAYRSFLGRLSYDFKDKYLLQANIRYDGSSRFHRDYRWGAFPSISAGWVISKEPFMEKLTQLSFLKLRGSWGVLGNERIGNYPYQSIINFSNTLLYQGTNIVSVPTAAQYAYAIRDISWESTSSYNVGLDVGLLNNRLSLTADVYKKTTKDMLLALEIPDYMGFSNPDQNTGKMYTKGWELVVEWKDKIGELQYGVSANISDFKSVLGDLGGIQFLGDKVRVKDSEFDEWYGYRSLGLYQSKDDAANAPALYSGLKPGDVKYADVSGPDGVPDGIISEYDKVLLGGSLPRYMYGGNINLEYRHFDFSLTFQGVGKQTSRLTANMIQPYLGSWGNMPMEIQGKYWSAYNSAEQNLSAVYPRLTSTFASNNYAMSDFWLFNGSYFRIKNIMLGYSLPEKIANRYFLKACRVYVAVSDILSLNKYPEGWDPEVANTGYPITTSYNLGLSITF